MAENANPESVEKWPPFIEGLVNYEPPRVEQTIPKKTVYLKRLISYYRDILDHYKETEENIRYSLVNKIPVAQIDFTTSLILCAFPGIAETIERLRQLERALEARKFKRQKSNGVIRNPDTISDIDIERVREYPIKHLVKVKANTTTCLWHADRHPSMHVYKDHAYCFVCNKRADSIDFVQHLYNLDFVGAVQYLKTL